MDWEKDEGKLVDEQMRCQYVESELKTYYWHLARYRKISRQIEELRARYQEELDHPGRSTSIIRPPEGNDRRSPWQIEWSGRLYDLEQKLKEEKGHLDMVEDWLTICLPEHEAVIRQYVMKQQCKDAYKASLVTGYSEDHVRKLKQRIILRIVREKLSAEDTA